MPEENFNEGLTFDDVLLAPQYSECLPHEIDLTTRITPRIDLKIPLMSAAMDTVTEARMAISLAREGGVGVIHRNIPVETQAAEVEQVKKSESGMIVDPITMEPDHSIRQALEVMKRFRISGVPIVKGEQLAGILTNRDLRFVEDIDRPVSEFMTKDNLVTVPEGITLEESKRLLHENRIEKLLVVDGQGRLRGLITIKDIEKIRKYPLACKDSLGRLRVGAAVGVGDDRESRTQALVDAGVDFIVVDTAHGHSRRVLEAVADTRRNWPDLEVMGGNVASAEGAESLIEHGCQAVKVGVGPGSICTTRIVSGVGVPQITAVMECSRVGRKHGVPVISDGGIRYSGDVTKALAAGADAVMIGSLLAGTEESPGQTVLYQGRTYKVYRGMGSLEVMEGGSASRDRYGQDTEEAEIGKLVPEGVEGRVPFRGPVSESIFQMAGGVRSGMGYIGARNLRELHEKARFIRISDAGARESHVHDVIMTREPPNYRLP